MFPRVQVDPLIAMMLEAGNTSEMLVNLYRLHKATSKKIHLQLA
jgi:hypothetical protein